LRRSQKVSKKYLLSKSISSLCLCPFFSFPSSDTTGRMPYDPPRHLVYSTMFTYRTSSLTDIVPCRQPQCRTALSIAVLGNGYQFLPHIRFLVLMVCFPTYTDPRFGHAVDTPVLSIEFLESGPSSEICTAAGCLHSKVKLLPIANAPGSAGLPLVRQSGSPASSCRRLRRIQTLATETHRAEISSQFGKVNRPFNWGLCQIDEDMRF
jgi:hypothetical protein